eukprot:s1915_g1.t1
MYLLHQVAFAALGLPWRRRSLGRRPLVVGLRSIGGAAVGGAGRCAETPTEGGETHRVVFPWLGSSPWDTLDACAQRAAQLAAESDGLRLSQARQGDAMLVELGPAQAGREAWHVHTSSTGTWTLQKVWLKRDEHLMKSVAARGTRSRVCGL